MSSAQPPVSRRERPAKPALTRDVIVTTALELMRTEGLARTTMRRLAQELDTGAASLYVYVRNTAQLHAAILDELLGTVDLGAAGKDDPWRDRLVEVLTSYALVLFEYPALAQSALVARPSGPHYFDLVERLLALLREGGTPDSQAAWGVDLLLQFATATAAEHSVHEQSIDSQDDWDALAVALANARAQRHPHIAALADELLSGTGPERLAWGFAVLIDGILHTPRPRSEQPPAQ